MQRNENRRSREGERRAEHAAQHREQDALGEELSNEPRTRRTKRRPDGNLALPRVRALKCQNRNIGARDQEDDTDGAEENEQHVPYVAEDVVLCKDGAPWLDAVAY